MKSSIGHLHLHWLMAPGAQVATPVDDSLTLHRMDYQLPPDMG